MEVNDHYHRPKRKIIQKVMEATGGNPEDCISQSELDKYSELDNVRDAFRAIGLDPQRLCLRLCDQDPPDCQAYDVNGNLVGWEVTGLYDQEAEKHNAEAKTVKDMVCRDWTEKELVAEIARTIKVKDKKIGAGKVCNQEWPFVCVNIVITTDELLITREMADSMQGRFSTLDTIHLKEVYLLLPPNPPTIESPASA